MYQIKEAAQLSGISVKTLHHYDKIGLLIPQSLKTGIAFIVSQIWSGLQIILFHKYLGFSLKGNSRAAKSARAGIIASLEQTIAVFAKQERKHLDTLISTLQKTIQAQKEKENDNTRKFVGLPIKIIKTIATKLSKNMGKLL